MLEFKAKMHKTRFPVGLRLIPCRRRIQRSPDLLAVFNGLLLRGGTGRGGDGKIKQRQRG